MATTDLISEKYENANRRFAQRRKPDRPLMGRVLVREGTISAKCGAQEL